MPKVQKASRISRMGSALSKWPHLLHKMGFVDSLIQTTVYALPNKVKKNFHDQIFLEIFIFQKKYYKKWLKRKKILKLSSSRNWTQIAGLADGHATSRLTHVSWLLLRRNSFIFIIIGYGKNAIPLFSSAQNIRRIP